MAQQFTKNYTDHSNDSGFQFEFHCDKCGSGFRSSFKANKLGMAAGLLKAAGSIFGGSLANAGYGADHVKDMLRGSAWDDAYGEAIAEIKPKFHQCTRCGKWVCPEVCWNAERSLCEECAPNLQEQAASIQAHVAVEQTWDKARKVDQTEGLDVAAKQASSSTCPKCNAALPVNAKFCAGCGTPVGAKAKIFCTECGGEMAPAAKFCPGCGAAKK
jgi:hypothetical protein